MTTNENGNFTGKVAFVTGAGSGIGRAAALAFAREGASVVAADVSGQGNQETVRLIEAQGGRAVAVRCDVTRAADVKAALDKTVEAFGRLDFAFNNAGVEPRKSVPTADYEEEEWDRIVDTKEARQNNLAISPINMVCLAPCRTPSHRLLQRSLPS
jgi:NAD(P)-dependent dehydrogenase (short-subunit alcohol dehydrogenase family)